MTLILLGCGAIINNNQIEAVCPGRIQIAQILRICTNKDDARKGGWVVWKSEKTTKTSSPQKIYGNLQNSRSLKLVKSLNNQFEYLNYTLRLKGHVSCHVHVSNFYQ